MWPRRKEENARSHISTSPFVWTASDSMPSRPLEGLQTTSPSSSALREISHGFLKCHLSSESSSLLTLKMRSLPDVQPVQLHPSNMNSGIFKLFLRIFLLER